MVKLYKEKIDKKFEAKVQAFGFREMPEKLAISIKTSTTRPMWCSSMKCFSGVPRGGVPFLELGIGSKRQARQKHRQEPQSLCV